MAIALLPVNMPHFQSSRQAWHNNNPLSNYLPLWIDQRVVVVLNFGVCSESTVTRPDDDRFM